MSLMEGFLGLDATGYYNDQTARRNSVAANKRAESVLGMETKKFDAEQQQERSSDIFNKALRNGWTSYENPLETTGKLTADVASGDPLAQDFTKNMLVEKKIFGEGVEPDQITFDPKTQMFALATKNAKGERGAATYDGTSDDTSEVIQVPATDIQGIFNLFYGTTVLDNLGEDAESRLAEFGATGAYLNRARKILQQSQGSDMELHRDQIALLAKAGAPDVPEVDKQEALDLAEEMAKQQGSLSDNPEATNAYDGAVDFDQLAKLGVTAEDWEGSSPTQKAQIVKVLNDKRNIGLAGDFAKAAPEATFDFITAPARAGLADIGESIATSRLGKALGMSSPTQEPRDSTEVALDNPNFTSGMTDARQAAVEMQRPLTLEQVDSSFAQSKKLAAAQKQLNRFNELEAEGELTPRQKARKRKLEDDIKAGGDNNTNTEANKFLIENSSDKIEAKNAPVVAQAAPEWQKQIEGKSLQEVNQMITDGTVKLSQTEAQNLAKRFDEQGIKTINDVYASEMSALDKAESLQALAVFTTDPSTRQRLQQAAMNLEDGGTLTMTPNEVIDNNNQSSAANTSRSKNRLDWEKYVALTQKNARENTSTAITTISGIIDGVNDYMYDDNNQLVTDKNSVRKLLQQDLVELDLQSSNATNTATQEQYREAKARLLSLALQSIANSGRNAGFIEQLSSLFSDDASGASRKELNNISSDGQTIFYQEPDSNGKLQQVGTGISMDEIRRANSELWDFLVTEMDDNQKKAAAGS